MSANATVQEIARHEDSYGFVTDLEADTAPRGLNEDVMRVISAKKSEPSGMLDWRLRAYHHWLTLAKSEAEPKWANVPYAPIDNQDINAASSGRTRGAQSFRRGSPRGTDRTRTGAS